MDCTYVPSVDIFGFFSKLNFRILGPKCWRINTLGDEAQKFVVGRVVVVSVGHLIKSKPGCLNIFMYLYLLLLYLYTTTD